MRDNVKAALCSATDLWYKRMPYVLLWCLSWAVMVSTMLANEAGSSTSRAHAFDSSMSRTGAVTNPGLDAHESPQSDQKMPGDSQRAVMETFVIREFGFVGNTVFATSELERITKSYTNRPITRLELEEARVALTQFYITNGYINSGALLKDQPTNGIATFTIVEGRLSEIRVHGNKWIGTSFYKRRLLANGGDPLNVNRIHNTLEIWRDAYPLEQVNAELRPGDRLGGAIMDVKVKEKFPFHFGTEYANDKPPSTGSEQVTALLRADSLTGHADILSMDYGIARGKGHGMDRADFLGPDDIAASYAVPLSATDTALGLQYARSSAAIVEAPFDRLNISSESVVYGLSLSQPLYRTPNREFSLTLAGERKSNDTTLLGVPYSLSEGAVNGASVVSAVRCSAQYTDRNASRVFSARATVSGGLDALNATRNATGPDGRFVSFLGQAQYLQRLWNTQNEVMFRVAGQYSPDPLLALEQLSIGGVNTVRGYRENTLVRDMGCVGTAEFHVPVLLGRDERRLIQLAPFVSCGAGWNNGRATPDPKDIASAGIGLMLNPCKYLEASLFWGHAFRDIHQLNHDLQDDGINFKIIIWML